MSGQDARSAAQDRWPDGSADECPKCGFLHAYDRSCEDRASSAAQGREKGCTCRDAVVQANAKGALMGHEASCPLHWKVGA